MDNVSFVVISFLVISSVDSATIHMGSFSIQYTQIAPTETDGYKIIYVISWMYALSLRFYLLLVTIRNMYR